MKLKNPLLLGIAVVALAVGLLCTKIVFLKKPVNVLLITMDTTRADRLSCYGYDKPTTPHIDLLAAENTLFEYAVAPIPYTFPSHLTIMTGTLPIYHGSHDNDGKVISDSHLTLAEVLKQRGYKTGAILASYVLNAQFGLNQGFDMYHEFNVTSKGNTYYANGRRASEIAKLSNQWFEENKKDKFFLFSHFYDSHFPYDPPAEFAGRFEDPYDGEIASVDAAVGQMIDKLKELDIYDNTLIIIEADHGELLGQHGEAGHGYYIYEGATRVPLIVKLPGSNKPQRISDTVGLVDIFPTVCGVLGIEVPDFVQGADLGPYFKGGRIDSDRYQYTESMTATKFGGNSLLGVVKYPYKYIQTTRPELYHVVKDPAEENNLVSEEAKRARFMQGTLKDILDTCTSVTASEEQEVDPATRKQLESLGYIGGEVDASLSFDQTKPDPKDIQHLYTLHRKVIDYTTLEDWAKAKFYCDKLIEKMPDFELAQMMLAQIWLGKVRSEPNNAKTHGEAGDIFFKLKRYEQAIESWNKAFKLGGGTAGLHRKLAAANLKLNRTDEATRHLLASLTFDPNRANVYVTLGDIAYNKGDKKKAMEYWTKSLKIDPVQPNLHDNVAKGYYAKGRIDKAIRHWTESVRLQPDSTGTLNTLAWLLSTSQDPTVRNPERALEYASRACELTGFKQADLVDTLAVAYAADGQFQLAIENAQKAIELAISAGQEDLVDKINERLELYKNNHPFYE